MKYINLNGGRAAMVDDRDYERLKDYRWKAIKDVTISGDRWYAIREEGGRAISMHQDVLGIRPGKLIDHRDNNGLNNQSANLRYATPAQNQANRVKQPNASSQFKGVTKLPVRFVARIKVGNKMVHLGTFKKEEDAARAYDTAAIRYYGEFAKLNFPTSRS